MTFHFRTTQTSSTPLQFINKLQAIINNQRINPLINFTLRNWRSISSSWLDRLRISDRKFVNHTTEMILWSMILKIHDFNEKFIKVNVYKSVCFIFQKDTLVQWNWKKMLPKCSISYIFYQIYPLFASSYFSFKDFSKHQWSFQYLLNYRATYNHSATLKHTTWLSAKHYVCTIVKIIARFKNFTFCLY